MNVNNILEKKYEQYDKDYAIILGEMLWVESLN